MNSLADQQLLRDYAESRSETAFAELVRRHVDFVYSAALRMVRDTHLAEDVTQGVFVAFAQNARQLTDRPVLSGWLHRTAQNLAANTVRSEVRRRAREQEAAAMNELLATEPDAAWEHIAPQLDAALGELSDADRDALLLRYFERKSASEMAQTLGTSEDAAQKRVSRAVEHLREFLSKRGVAIGASGLVVVISANAVQAAPVGLAVTISTAAVLAGTTIATTTTTTAIKTVAMITLQKALITTTLAVVAGGGIYEARQASTLRSQVQALQQQEAPLAEQIQRLQHERDKATNRLAMLAGEMAETKSNSTELLKLRGEVGVLRQQKNELGKRLESWRSAAAANNSRNSTNQLKFPRESWGFAGYDTPEAALESLLWAKSQGDEKNWLAGLTGTNTIRQLQNDYIKGETDDERSQFLRDQTKQWTGFQILNSVPIADDQVELQVELEIQSENGTIEKSSSINVMKKNDGQWKVLREYMGEGFSD
ncbi:MAG: RNA polymerase sigma factor [Verrucomicrobiota bacterium]